MPHELGARFEVSTRLGLPFEAAIADARCDVLIRADTWQVLQV